MANPLAVALRGKGPAALLRRSTTLGRRYGLTPARMRRALNLLADTLDAYGCRATLPVTAAALKRSPRMAHWFRERGIEPAVHGWRHEDHAGLSYRRQLETLLRARQAFLDLRLEPAGFRCPYLRWNDATLHALVDAGFRYDSSQAIWFDEGFDPQALAGGTPDGERVYQRALEFYRALPLASVPALPALYGGLARIPYCLPDDEALVERLPGAHRAQVWEAMLRESHRRGELLTLGLHPERAGECREALAHVLALSRSLPGGVWVATLGEIADWQRCLAGAVFHTQLVPGGVCISAELPAGGVLLGRRMPVERGGNLEINENLLPGGFAPLAGDRVLVSPGPLPMIDLPGGGPPGLADFLRAQGFAVQSDAAQPCVLQLEMDTFCPQDERKVLDGVHAGNWPLLRIARWPGAARSALAVTGDVDAFTLWDYGLRVFGG